MERMAVLYPSSMKILVVSSCTNEKDSRGFTVLSRCEIDALRLSGLLKLHSQKGRMARELYTGQQHKQLFLGVDLLRNRFGPASCEVKIISAAYGLVAETERLLPYEATFNEKGINTKRRGKELNIAPSIQRSMRGFPLVFFLLGKEYLKSIHEPLIPMDGQKLVFFAPPSATLPAKNGILVPIESKGSGNIAIKGRAFKWLAVGMDMTSTDIENLMSDTVEKISRLIQTGQTEWTA